MGTRSDGPEPDRPGSPDRGGRRDNVPMGAENLPLGSGTPAVAVAIAGWRPVFVLSGLCLGGHGNFSHDRTAVSRWRLGAVPYTGSIPFRPFDIPDSLLYSFATGKRMVWRPTAQRRVHGQ